MLNELGGVNKVFETANLMQLMSILPNPLPEGGWYNDTCIFGPIYGFIQNIIILYELISDVKKNIKKENL